MGFSKRISFGVLSQLLVFYQLLGTYSHTLVLSGRLVQVYYPSGSQSYLTFHLLSEALDIDVPEVC